MIFKSFAAGYQTNAQVKYKTETGTDLEKARRLLEAGEVVAIPTETVYGLAANALHPDAVVKIYEAKQRPRFNPLIIHLPDWSAAAAYTLEIPAEAELLAKHFTPGPLTFLLKKSGRIPDLVTAGSPKVAVRIPAHPLTHELLTKLDFPLSAPSANPFGYVSPTTARHVFESLNGRIPYILDGGACQVGVESTIVDFEDGQVIVRRKGGTSLEAMTEVLGRQPILKTGVEDHPVAPGLLKSHYATATPLFAGNLAVLTEKFSDKKRCIIAFGNNAEGLEAFKVFQLSASGNTEEAAKNLFSVMRQADNCGADVIIADWLPETGLGPAINDRLSRAQAGGREE